MVYGENGRFLSYVDIFLRMVSYRAKLFSGQEKKTVYILYKYLLTQYNNEIFKNPLIDCMHFIFDNC